MNTLPDRIEKQAVLRAPIERVWEALSDSAQFGAWFKARFRGPFVAGSEVVGELAEPGHVGRLMVLAVETLDAPHLLSFRWRPHELEKPSDSWPASTLVEFRLEPHPEGTLLVITESGFEAIPESERADYVRGNSEGWEEQLGRIASYVSGTDRIEKTVSLQAPVERVWRALSVAEEFGQWFGLDAAGETFAAGRSAHMKIAEPADYAGRDFTIEVVALEPPRLFSFRWHPCALDPGVDYSSEPMTLVEFFLEPRDNGTLLTVTETGFDAIPAGRRATAFRMNEGGWAEQVQRIRRYVDA
jgi:uncharacterized protein YndB with AHSA1/START domain